MKTLLIGLLSLGSISAFASTFAYPTFDGMMFEPSKRNADIACYVMTIENPSISYKAVSYIVAKISHKNLAPAYAPFGGKHVGVISKQSYWIYADDFKAAETMVKSIYSSENKMEKVISELECE